MALPFRNQSFRLCLVLFSMNFRNNCNNFIPHHYFTNMYDKIVNMQDDIIKFG